MVDVNAAELRRALEAPPGQQWTSMTPGRSAVQTEVPYVIVNRSTLKAVLDAYERDQEASGFEEWYAGIVHAHAVLGGKPDELDAMNAMMATAYEAGRRFAEQEEAERRTAALRAHPDYQEAIKAAGKKPQPGALLSTDEEIRAVIHAGNPNRKASPHGRVHGQEPGEAAAPSGGDDLTALLRRELSAGPCNRCGGTCLDAEAARLAEVVRRMLENLTVEAVLLAKNEREAARKSESEAVGLLREVVECPQPSLDYTDAFQRARAYLARRKEATDA